MTFKVQILIQNVHNESFERDREKLAFLKRPYFIQIFCFFIVFRYAFTGPSNLRSRRLRRRERQAE
jgi:hypothetical protein